MKTIHCLLAAMLACAAPALAQPTAAPTTREGLETLAEQAMHALLANDAARLPLAPGFRYTENGQALEIGDGMWGTLSAYAGEDPRSAPAAAPLAFRFDVVDPARGEIIAYRAIDENGTRGLLTLRLRTEAGRIREMEAIPVRHEYAGRRGGTVTLQQARHPNMFDPDLLGAIDPVFAEPAPGDRADLIAAANAYFDGLVAARSAKIPFDPACRRRENGHRSTDAANSPPLDPTVPAFRPWALGCAAQIDSGLFRYIEAVRDRRFVVDPARGLVAAIDVVDVPGTLHEIVVPKLGRVRYPNGKGTTDQLDTTEQFNEFGNANLDVPSSALAVHLFKIRDGRILRIESVFRPAPYGLRSGW